MSAESHPPWLDVHVHVDVVKDCKGCRELHCHIQAWAHHAHIVVSMRRLIFWMAVLICLVPAGAFQLVPRMPSMAARMPTQANTCLSLPARVHILDNITATALGASPLTTVFERAMPTESIFGNAILSESRWSEPLVDPAALFAGSAEALSEEFDMCIVDAATDDDLSACLSQAHSTSLDELSSLIVREGCEVLNSKDDGTLIGLVGQVLHTAKEEGIEALAFRKLAVRACVSATLHKLTVTAAPFVTCMTMHAPDLLHKLPPFT